MPRFPNQPPKRRYGLQWDHVKLAVGAKWHGWLAGPPVTIHCHYDGSATKACRQEMSGGALSCPFCAAGIHPMPKTYVPCWSETGRPMFAVVIQRYAPLIVGAPDLAPIRVTKLASAGSPICVEQVAWSVHRPPVAQLMLLPQDITDWLLRTWKDDELRDWCIAHPNGPEPDTLAGKFAAQDTPDDLDATQWKLRGMVLEDLKANARREGQSEEAIADVIAAHPSLNGKHRKKGK